jgi:hypothetical protein
MMSKKLYDLVYVVQENSAKVHRRATSDMVVLPA